MNISPTIFGSSEAARNLSDMVAASNNPVYLRKVARFLNANAAMVKTLDAIPNVVNRKVLAKLVHRHILETTMELPKKMKTHAINVAIGRLRHAMERWEQDDNTAPLIMGGSEFEFLSETEQAIAETRRLDAEDVLSGKISQESLFFIPREMAQNSKPVFPKTYRKS